jgi:hypothetical protein
MADLLIEQAVYGSQGAGGYRFLARSPGFRDEWLAEAERLCTGFGERPAGVACPACVFARPFGPRQVAVVQAADQGADDAGRPGALAFRLLVVPRALYDGLGGDPFYLAEQFPPPWRARGELPALAWEAEPPPPRTVAALQKVLDVPYSATLLGGVQALLDGGRLAFERTGPDPHLVRSLWALLPTSTRARLWPATFAFGNAHGFDVVVVPRASGPDFAGYLLEAQAGDYTAPEPFPVLGFLQPASKGPYELRLQTAVEAGDQREVDALLARRSRAQTLRLALALLAVFILVPAGVTLFTPVLPAPRPARAPAAAARPDLPPADACPALPREERARLAQRLQGVGRRLGVDLPQGDSAAALTDALAELDARLKTPDPNRDPGALRDLGPLQRQLRALLWKHHVPDYNARGLNTTELVERLEKRLAEEGVLEEGVRE